MHLPLLFLVTFTITLSFADDVSFSGCDRTFSCGPIQNITYPFTGGDRPAYCGPPEFRLTCPDINSYPELIANSLTYRVLEINQARRILKLVRVDLYDNNCPEKFINSTLNSTIFTYGPDNVDLTLVYGCPSSPLIQSMFTCNVKGVSFNDTYYFIGPVPVPNFICAVSLMVPILRIVGDGLTGNLKTLGEVLNAGFNVNFSDPYSRQCLDCRLSGGQCGFDSNSIRPICICGHSLCIGAGNSSASNLTTLGIVLPVIGSVLAGICIGWLIFFCRRRKRTYALSSRVKAMSFWKARESRNHNIETFIRDYGPLTPKRYTYTDVKKMTNSFDDKLGQGGYGGVYKGKLSDGRLVAVKVLNETKGNGEEFINEVASISRTSHVNVVTLLGFCFDRNRRALIYEFMPNKSLDKFIYVDRSSDTSQSLDWKTLYQIAVGIARGLEYLHRGCNTRIVHFDIKPQNILLDEDFCPKISDFGLAKLFKKKESVISMLGARGTAGFIAPEVFSRNFGRVSHKSDVYSYGMMVLEMVGASKKSNLAGVAHSSEVYFPDWIYEHLGRNGTKLGIHDATNDDEEGEAERKMMLVSLWCIQTIPADRPSMSKVVEMLEGNIQSLQIPAKPLLHCPTRSAQDSYISLPLSSENTIEAMNSISG